MDFKPGEILVYRDRVYKKDWRVIALHRHPDWVEYMVCYCIEAPPQDIEDLNTVLNLPVFSLHRQGQGYGINLRAGFP